MRRLIGVAALAAALAGCGSQPPQGISLRIDRAPFRVSVLDDGKALAAEDAATRLRFELQGSSTLYGLTKVLSVHGDTYDVATSDPGRSATVSVSPRPGGAAITVALHPARGVLEVFDAFDSTPGAHFLGGGERGVSVDLAGQVLPIEVNDECTYAPVPFFASSAGWGLRLDSENRAGLAFPGSPGGGGCQANNAPVCSFPALGDTVSVCVQGATLSEDVYVGSIPQVLADYERDSGIPRVPPASELELIKWRDGFTTPAEVLQEIERLQAARIPIGWVELDDPWEVCRGQLTFNPAEIPDPRRLIAEVHARGVLFMLWISPKATCAQGYPHGGTIGPASDPVLDLRNPAVLKVFRARLRRLFGMGVDGVKADRGDEIDFDAVSPSLTNEYALLYARAVLAVMPRGDAAIFRAATMGSQAVLPGIWAGDQEALWSGLQTAIVEAQTAAMSGFPTWGSDIGGFSSTALTPELFARWAQLGAVSPVMEVGGTGPNATPWVMGPAAMAALRDAAVLHYELFPYLYGLLERHQPVLAPLAYAFPGDAHSWASPLELMVGPDLMAAPVTGPGTTPSVYLPPGSWVDLYSGSTVVGGGPTFTRPTPLDEFPLYARAGSVIPFDLRTGAGSWWSLDQLSRPGYTGYLATNGALLSLRRQPAHVQLFVPAPARPSRVTLGGRPVAWTWTAGPLPGVVVRVHGPVVRGRIFVLSP